MNHVWKQGDIYSAGTSRIVFKPDWSPSKPFATYIRGSAEQCFSSFKYALRHIGGKRKGDKIIPIGVSDSL
jgi:hypothetical protein